MALPKTSVTLSIEFKKKRILLQMDLGVDNASSNPRTSRPDLF